MNITTPLGNNFATYPNYDNYQSYYYPRLNSSFPLGIHPYVSLSGYNSYRYPSLSYSQYSYPSLIGLNAYPNTLSTILPQPADLSQIKKIDVASMPIVPADLLERPKQADNRLHDLNPMGNFSYHAPDSPSKLYPKQKPIEPAPNMLRHLLSPLFTSPGNFQYILPNGRIGELYYHVQPLETNKLSNDDVNKQIYEAKKAKGEKFVFDVLGRPYDPNKKYDVNDNQDFHDESLKGQIIDYYKYNTLDPDIHTPQNQAFVRNSAYIANNNMEGYGDKFISDMLGSASGLLSPKQKSDLLKKNELQMGNNFMYFNPMSPMPQMQSGGNQLDFILNSMNDIYNYASMDGSNSSAMGGMGSPMSMMGGMGSPMSMMGGMGSPMSMMGGMGSPMGMMGGMGSPMSMMDGMGSPMSMMGGMGSPMSMMGGMGSPMSSDISGMNSVFNTTSFNANDLVDQTKPFNPNEKSRMGIDYTGTAIGEYYHILQYMQESMAAITQQKPLFLDFNGNSVSQEFASKNTTGNVPFFDAVSESYGWMQHSPYYQDYVQSHINGVHGGVHDVITPRGFDPKKFMYGNVPTSVSWDSNDVYKTPYAAPVTVTDPRLNLF